MKKLWLKDINSKTGENVSVSGWVNARRDHGKLIFIDLRDRSGLLQVVFSPKHDSYEQAKLLRSEWVVTITGLVKERPDNMKNSDLVTGDVELEAHDLEVLASAETPPISVEGDGYDIGEDVRMKYRYLDLRRPRMRDNLIMRGKALSFVRKFLSGQEFIEVETPILTKSTPEGARDYLVPSRLHSGMFYALPQSPQQYKQLLMVAGLERYFQIARCFRDEDTRGDRQPEFTQIDIEASFVSEEEILSLTQDMFLSLVKELYPNKKLTLNKDGSIPTISYKEAMEKYGTDRPDVRVNPDDPDELAFLFVVDFPMFEWRDKEKRLDAVHHPFTRPKLSDGSDDPKQVMEMLKKAPKDLLAHQYDLVLNGNEVSGGSLRTYDADILAAVFEVMGNKKKDIKEKFGHLLEAFSYGVPPHGGIACGFDRLMSVLENEPNIREVIAFPKTGDGRDLMMEAPSEVSKEQLDELEIQIVKNKKHEGS